MRNTHALRALIAHIAANNNEATISLAQISKLCFITNRAAVSLIRRLEDAGYLLIERQQNKPNTYTIPTEVAIRQELSNLLNNGDLL